MDLPGDHMSAPYLLSPHVHICVAGGQVVLLDLLRNKYSAVIPPHCLAEWVQDWPVPAPKEESSTQSPKGRKVLEDLLARGMLAGAPGEGKPAIPIQIAPPSEALVQPVFDVRPKPSSRQMLRFARAHFTARRSLRRPIAEVIAAAARRKTQGTGAGTAPAALREEVAAFIHMRPLLYTARQECLIDCITLLHYLAPLGVFPDWVFGVQADPFYPHCWLQQGDFVFNDEPDRVRGFAPIMVV